MDTFTEIAWEIASGTAGLVCTGAMLLGFGVLTAAVIERIKKKGLF